MKNMKNRNWELGIGNWAFRWRSLRREVLGMGHQKITKDDNL
jgi:hypothetical protein